MRRRKRVFILVVSAALIVCGLYFSLQNRDKESLFEVPKSADKVRFYESSGWQRLRLFLSFHAEPEVARNFLQQLLRERFSDFIQSEKPFVSFPVDFENSSQSPPDWFQPDSVKEGILIESKDGGLAVIGEDGNFFFYYSH